MLWRRDRRPDVAERFLCSVPPKNASVGGENRPRVLARSLQRVQPTASPQPAADPCAVSFQMLAWLCPSTRSACGLRLAAPLRASEAMNHDTVAIAVAWHGQRCLDPTIRQRRT